MFKLFFIRFSKDGGTLYSSGEGGEVYIWDIRSHDCLHKFQDEGCVVGTSLDVSSHHLATGKKIKWEFNINNAQ